MNEGFNDGDEESYRTGELDLNELLYAGELREVERERHRLVEQYFQILTYLPIFGTRKIRHQLYALGDSMSEHLRDLEDTAESGYPFGIDDYVAQQREFNSKFSRELEEIQDGLSQRRDLRNWIGMIQTQLKGRRKR